MNIVLTHNNFTFDASTTSKCSKPAWVPKWHPAWLAFSWVVLKKPHGPDDLDRFVKFCNVFNPTIKFTSESSAKEIPFLDVMVSIKDGQLHTDLYSKPTDAHQFLHWTSCHPKHTKTSLPYDLAFGLNCICSSQESLQKRITDLEGFLKARVYSNSIIKRQISKALEIPRSDALEPRATRSNNTDRIPLVITYHPPLSKLSKILNKHLRIFHSSDKCKKAILNISMFAYRRSSNVKDMVVRSTLPPDRPHPRGSFACGTCRSCHHKHDRLYPKQGNQVSHTEQGATFTSSSTSETYIIRKHLTCQTENVVYLLTCTLCQSQYVGETCHTLENSLSIVLMSVTRGTLLLPDIFRLPGHPVDNISVMCIDKPPKSDTTMRKDLEKDLIIKLQTS